MEDRPNPPPQRTGPDWDRITAVAAVLIGLAAVAVSAYTVLLQREQIRAEVWPRLGFYYAGIEGEFRLANKGVGPAIIESVQVTVDEIPVRDWAEATTRLGLEDPGQLYSSLGGAVLSPGEHVSYLMPSTPQAFAEIRREAGRIAVTVCYCSALRDCWLIESRGDTLREVDSCPAVDPALRFDN